jgi:hypothetical protein
MDITYAFSVADGYWHHAAMTVDASGGKLYVDGVLAGSSVWVGTAGGCSTTEPLQNAKYWTTASRFYGDIDEVALWNRLLGQTEINYLKHRQLDGSEEALVDLWHFDEGSGSTTADATGHGSPQRRFQHLPLRRDRLGENFPQRLALRWHCEQISTRRSRRVVSVHIPGQGACWRASLIPIRSCQASR